MWPFKKKDPPSPELINIGKATVVLIFDNGQRENVYWKGDAEANAFEAAKRWCADCADLGFFHYFEKDGAVTWVAARRIAEIRITWVDHFVPLEEA